MYVTIIISMIVIVKGMPPKSGYKYAVNAFICKAYM